MGVVSPLGLLVGGDHATETFQSKMIASPSSWISITDEALQAEATRFTSYSSSSLVL